jgi:hypothetical protein
MEKPAKPSSCRIGCTFLPPGLLPDGGRIGQPQLRGDRAGPSRLLRERVSRRTLPEWDYLNWISVEDTGRFAGMKDFADEIVRVNAEDPFSADRLDLERVGIYGGSYGGIAAKMCRRDDRLKCVVPNFINVQRSGEWLAVLLPPRQPADCRQREYFDQTGLLGFCSLSVLDNPLFSITLHLAPHERRHPHPRPDSARRPQGG